MYYRHNKELKVINNRSFKLLSNVLIGSLVSGIMIGLMSLQASGQVVIVPSRFRSERGPDKSRSKARRVAASRTQKVRITPVPESDDSSADRLPPLAFSINLPDLELEKTSEKEPAEKPVVQPLSLSVAGFKVLTSDARGKVKETRIESTRFYNQELPGAVNLEMVELQSGAFMMGADRIELESIQRDYVKGVDRDMRAELIDRIAWESPQHQVSVSAISMSRYEITQTQWRAVAGLPKVEIDLISDPSQFKGGNRPVENVSWAEAVEFCARLSRLTGRTYRLPTEAEWEYACRAGTNSPFNFGGALNPEWANYNGRKPYGANSKGSFRGQTLPAGSLGFANAFGLFDMHGNVWEWTQDGWLIDQSEIGSNPTLRVLRGGAWDSAAGECRSGARQRMDLIYRSNNIGFRVVREQ
ncbi:MAG: formylglycine-generating enzyme family protein [Acidobacteria bacterium]|nr:formylglycine-generating enzyme family protein [Acidobacteriota bacterium]